MKHIITSLLVLSGASLASAATYYIDFDEGNDTRNGIAETTAWKHAPGDADAAGNPAAATLQPGDTVLFKGGVIYRGAVQVNNSGAAGSPITYKGDGWGAERAVIDGSDELSVTWTRCPDAGFVDGNPNWADMWYADVPGGFDDNAFAANLHENDSFAYVAQSPTPPNPLYQDDKNEFWQPEEITRYYLVDSRLASLGGEALVGKWVFTYQGNNSVRNHSILSYVPAENKITFDIGATPYTGSSARYALANYVGFIDGPGQYVYTEEPGSGNTHRTFFWPRSGNPNTAVLTVSNRDYGIKINGKHHVTVEGFIIQKTAGTGQSVGANPIYVDNCSNIRIHDNTARHNRFWQYQGYGLYVVNSSRCLIDSNWCDHNPCCTGILTVNNTDLTVQYNKATYTGGTGIRCREYSKRCAFIGNYVNDVVGSHASGMICYGCDSIIFINNRIFSPNVMALQNNRSITFMNNIFISTDGTGEGRVLYNNGGVLEDIRVYNNVCLGSSVKHAGLEVQDAEYDVRNNILCGLMDDKNSSEYRHVNNIYTGYAWTQDARYGWSLGDGELYIPGGEASLFMDAENGDYRLKAGCEAVDAGTVPPVDSLRTNGFPDVDFTMDMAGNPRNAEGAWDIGPYEYSTVSIGTMQPAHYECPAIPANPWVPASGYDIVDTRGKRVDWRQVRNGVYLIRMQDGEAYRKVVIEPE